MLSTVKPAPPCVTYEEFLLRGDEDTRAEWVNGRVLAKGSATLQHQNESGFLLGLLCHWVESHDLGVVLYESFQMRTGPDLPGREPDLLFVANENRGRLRATFLDGPADLVVEIISPESVTRDRGEKFTEYETGGVREYWLLDPVRQNAEFFQRGEDGLFRAVPWDSDGVYRSAVLPGLYLRRLWLFTDTKPRMLDVLREWRLI